MEERILLADKIKRTASQIMLLRERPDLAAVLVECEFCLEEYEHNDAVHVFVPAQHHVLLTTLDGSYHFVRKVIQDLCEGNMTDQNGNFYRPSVTFVTKLIETDPGWEEVIKATVAQAGITNQGFVTELMFGRRGKDPVMHGELKFGSQTEVRIAQEFEARKVLFFPLAVGVKAETGVPYQDHREVDFLVIHDGVVGVLEVAGPHHAGRQVADVQKEDWFQTSGILCVKEYPSELCWGRPGYVVDSFLSLLAQHKRR